MKTEKVNSKNKNLFIGVIILGLVILAGIGYYATGYYAHNTSPTQSQVIKIGHIAPLTGFMAAYSEQESQGIDLAVEEINANGGINGKRLEVIREDDQFDATTATNAFNKFITVDKVPAVIGAMSSTNTLALAPIAENNKVVLISPLSTSSKISSAGDYIFRIYPFNALQAKELVKIASQLNITTCAIIYINNDMGTDFSQSISEDFTKNGGTVLISEGYALDETDFRTQLTKIKEKNPQAIFLAGYFNDMSMVVKQAKELGIHSQFLAPDTFNDPRIIELAGNASEGVIFVYPSNGEPTRWQQFNEKIKAKHGAEATIVTVMGYDTAKVLAAAMENGVTGEDIKTGLYRLNDYPGVSGDITFDKNGDVVSRVLLFRIVKDGKFEEFK